MNLTVVLLHDTFSAKCKISEFQSLDVFTDYIYNNELSDIDIILTYPIYDFKTK